jgi:hypothetical protein
MMNVVAERVQGAIGQETLTQVIARDELDPRRRRAPWLGNRINWNWPLKPPFPAGMSITRSRFCRLIVHWSIDVLPVGQWILSQFGRRHIVTATFMNHAIANENYGVRKKSCSQYQELTVHETPQILRHYVSDRPNVHSIVPITLRHFQILARLGRAPVRFTLSLT